MLLVCQQYKLIFFFFVTLLCTFEKIANDMLLNAVVLWDQNLVGTLQLSIINESLKCIHAKSAHTVLSRLYIAVRATNLFAAKIIIYLFIN